MPDPRSEISARLALHRERVTALDRADLRAAQARLGVFAAALALAWLAFGPGVLPAAWLAAPSAAFLALVVVHDGVLRRRARAARAVAFHEACLARMDGQWAGKGNPGARHLDPEHPSAADLDLFGAGGLFELVCAARTAAGEARVARLLLEPATAGEARARQAAVRELAPRLVLREELALLGEAVQAAVEPDRLAAWGAAPPQLPRWLRPGASALAGAAVVAGAAAVKLGLAPLVVVALGALAFRRAAREPLAGVLGGLDRPAAELEVLSLLLARLEREPVGDPRLRALQAAIAPANAPPASARIAALRRIATRLEWGKNQLFAPFAFLLQWGPLHAAAAEAWRRAHGGALRGWLDAVAELEALSSVAGYAFEHPGHVFPEVVDPGEGAGAAFLEADALAHPLLAGCVPNDVRLGGTGPRALLVSGSNMSGKSTYLRTVGLAVVLAQAGAPVPARRLRLTPLRPGATLRIQDSLQAGRSRFYAEITRLETLYRLATGAPPLLFLLDEILHGTNSHDRRIGAEALVRALLEAGAIGIVTTHDLALTDLAADRSAPAASSSGGLAPGALVNAHFEDQVKDGRIAFDYTLRPGVVRHSNALALMRGVGLPV